MPAQNWNIQMQHSNFFGRNNLRRLPALTDVLFVLQKAKSKSRWVVRTAAILSRCQPISRLAARSRPKQAPTDALSGANPLNLTADGI